MRRHIIPPRHDWRDRARELGFSYAEIAGEPYWDETACWEFTSAEVDVLDDTLAELERAGTPCGPHDMQIGGHARSEGLMVVTNNMREFSRMPGIRAESWV